RQNKVAIYLSALGIFVIFFALGTQSPAPFLYEWMCFDAPVLASFGWLFRDPNKWVLLLPLVFSILLAFTCARLAALAKKLKNIQRKAAALTFVCLLYSLTFVYITPAATNYFQGPFKPIKIPEEIRQVNSWLASDSDSFQVLWLPSYAEHGATWVHSGLAGAFELDSSAKPTFDVGYKHVRSYLNYFEKTLLENRSASCEVFLNPLNIRYLIFHNDSIHEDYASRLLQGIESQENLKLVKQEGFVYVFENTRWLNASFQCFSETFALTGGFNQLLSLNSLIPDLSELALVLADEKVLNAEFAFDAFMLKGDLLSDALPFFLNESLLIIPFDFVKNHKPSEAWSKASLSDLGGGPFHPYLGQFDVDCWDFDYDKGVAFTWASNSKLDMSFSWPSTCNVTLFARIFKNKASGSLTWLIDGSKMGTIETRGQENSFAWTKIGLVKLNRGSHTLTLINDEGLNAVNLVIAMPEEKAEDIGRLFEMKLRGKDVFYVLEAESAQLENASVSSSRGGEASNGKTVMLSPSSSFSKKIELACAGNYTPLVKGCGRMLLLIDDSYVREVNLQNFTHLFLDSLSLTAGTHEIKVLSSSADEHAELDVAWLFKVERAKVEVEFRNEFSLNRGENRILHVKQLDHTKFVVEIDEGQPFVLCFSAAYNPAWVASYDGQLLSSQKVFAVVNGFWIDTSLNCVVVVELQSQRLFYVGLVAFLSTWLVAATWLFCASHRKKPLKKARDN
ncbi:MAG: hypothetical protein QXJ02_06275, partial [Candidatus Bathyarchaeia archaeon]